MAGTLPPKEGNPNQITLNAESVSTLGLLDNAQYGVRTAAALMKRAIKFYLKHKAFFDKALDLLQGSTGGGPIIVGAPPNPNGNAGEVKAALQTLANNILIFDNLDPKGAG